MNDNENSSTSSVAMLIFIVFLCMLIPYVVNEYLKVFYVYAMYWVSYVKFTILYNLTSLSIVRDNIDSIFFWVDWFLIDSSLPDGRLYPMINQIYGILIRVDTTSLDTVKYAFIEVDSLNGTFTSVGRLGVAIYYPLYMFFAAYIWYKLRTVRQYDTIFDLDTFAHTLAEGFPELLPVVYANPLKQDLDKGDWRMSPKIYSYLKNNDCITEYVDNGYEMFKLNEDELSGLLIEQLGEKWLGFDALTYEHRALLAVAFPMVNSPAHGKAEMHALIESLGYAHSSKPLFVKCLLAGVKTILISVFNIHLYLPSNNGANKSGKLRAVLKKGFIGIFGGAKESIRQRKYKRVALKLINKSINKYKNVPKVKHILSKHAYNSTVVAATIEKAWEGGVLPSCSCLWLKVMDRNLFYVFNNLGRYVSWIEVVGFSSHYASEKGVSAPYPYPKVEAGIEGIDDALDTSFYNYKPLFDR